MFTRVPKLVCAKKELSGLERCPGSNFDLGHGTAACSSKFAAFGRTASSASPAPSHSTMPVQSPSHGVVGMRRPLPRFRLASGPSASGYLPKTWPPSMLPPSSRWVPPQPGETKAGWAEKVTNPVPTTYLPTATPARPTVHQHFDQHNHGHADGCRKARDMRRCIWHACARGQSREILEDASGMHAQGMPPWSVPRPLSVRVRPNSDPAMRASRQGPGLDRPGIRQGLAGAMSQDAGSAG